MKKNHNVLKVRLTVIVGFLFSIIGLYYAYRDVSWNSLVLHTNRIDIPLTICSILLNCCGIILFRAILIKRVLLKVGDVTIWGAYRAVTIGYLVNNIFPMRIGDIARSAFISKKFKFPLSSAIGGLAVERLLDMSAIALLAFIAILIAPIPESLQIVAIITAVIITFAFIVLLILTRYKINIENISSSKAFQLFVKLWTQVTNGFSSFGNFKSLSILLFLISVIWLCNLGLVMLKLYAFGLESNMTIAVVMLTCIGFGVALPSAPGYTGLYHAAVVFALGIYQLPVEIAAAFALFSWLLDILVGNIAGAISMIYEGIRLSDVKKYSDLT